VLKLLHGLLYPAGQQCAHYVTRNRFTVFVGKSISRDVMQQVIVKAFCQEHAISYYETSVWQPYQEMLRYLRHVIIAVQLEEKGSRS
jgi:IS1 family transposase